MTHLARHKLTCTIATVSVVMVLCFTACRKDVKLQTDAVRDRAAIPTLSAREVSTLISDSGVTRYRIQAPSWQIFDKAQPPYWEFKEGIYMEKFDVNLHVDASLKADYAYYNEEEQIWRLDGNVHALNLEGEEFFTPQLFWSQHEERVYSDSAITIHRATSTIQGVGFESNQEMTKYTIMNPTGVIPVKEE